MATTLPKNKREYAATLARAKAETLRSIAQRIRHWIGPEPTRAEIADTLFLYALNCEDDATFAETVQGMDARDQVDRVVKQYEPRGTK